MNTIFSILIIMHLCTEFEVHFRSRSIRIGTKKVIAHDSCSRETKSYAINNLR